ASGRPFPAQIELYLGDVSTLAVGQTFASHDPIARATATPLGSFGLQLELTPALMKAAAANDGWLNFDLFITDGKFVSYFPMARKFVINKGGKISWAARYGSSDLGTVSLSSASPGVHSIKRAAGVEKPGTAQVVCPYSSTVVADKVASMAVGEEHTARAETAR